MRSHFIIEAEISGYLFENPVDGHAGHGFVFGTSAVAFAAEHIVVELTGYVLKIESYGVYDCFVDRDVTVAADLAGIAGFLFEDRECFAEDEVGGDEGGAILNKSGTAPLPPPHPPKLSHECQKNLKNIEETKKITLCFSQSDNY